MINLRVGICGVNYNHESRRVQTGGALGIIEVCLRSCASRWIGIPHDGSLWIVQALPKNFLRLDHLIPHDGSLWIVQVRPKDSSGSIT
jgi:hypothetical protein